jgi:hypothetical protein
VLRCPFSVAQEYAEDFFTEAVRDVASQSLVPSLGTRLSGTVKLDFREQFETLRPGRRHDALAIAWTGDSLMFADFRGTLELRVASITTTDATLEGRYRPRHGVVGRVFDRLFGYRIAQTMLGTIMERLAAALERGEAGHNVAQRVAPPG